MKQNGLHRRAVLATVTGIFATFLFAHAGLGQDRNDRNDDDEHDQARQALQDGLILPLADILAMVKDRLGGEIIGVKLESEDGRYVYEFKVLQLSGRVREIYVNAMNGEILKVEDD